MSTQVITIKPDGSVFSLQHKRGQGVDLRKLGHAEIQRATLIEWDEENQAWFIRWEDSDDVWGLQTFVDACITDGFGGGVLYLETPSGRVTCFFVETDRGYSEDRRASWPITQVLFEDYEDAVAAEVAVIQSLQLSGRMTTHRSQLPR